MTGPNRIHVPAARAGMNAFTTAGWWRDDPRVIRDEDAGDPDDETVQVEGDLPGVVGDRTLLVAGAITDLLAEPTREALDAWVAEVLAVRAAAPAPLHLAVSLDEVTSLDQLLTLAAGRRRPAFDVAAAAVTDPTAPIPPQSVPGGLDVVRAYADALVAQVEVLLAPSRQSAVDGVDDATACLSRALDADPDVDADRARALRDDCRAVLTGLEDEGITVSGPRDALLWPVPVERGLVPIDVAADAALEVMLGLLERPVDLAPDRPAVVPPAELPARALLGRLARTGGRG